jgi:hypothetical protein
VSANGKRWSAYIRYDDKQHYLGCFDTRQEAALAYDREARQCGKDKALNYESTKAAEEAAVQAHKPSTSSCTTCAQAQSNRSLVQHRASTV